MFSIVPPKISVPVFYVFATFVFLARFFVGNIYGVFILCLCIYFNAHYLFGIAPFSYEQLVLWIVSQSESTKVALLSSFITVLGFMLAYTTATANWKGQLLANLKLQAAADLDMFFSEYSKLVTDCEIYASSLMDAVNQIQAKCNLEDAEFLARYNYDQGLIFIQKRDRMIAMGIEVHSLQSRYNTLLLSTPNLKSSLDRAIEAVKSINEKLWFRVPLLIQEEESVIQAFVNQVNVNDCSAFKSIVNARFGGLNFSSGAVRGNLMSTVVGFNFWTVYHLYNNYAEYNSAIKERYSNSKRVNGIDSD